GSGHLPDRVWSRGDRPGDRPAAALDPGPPGAGSAPAQHRRAPGRRGDPLPDQPDGERLMAASAGPRGRPPTAPRGHHAHRERQTNEGAENYAKAIYHLQGRSNDHVHTNAVAERLGGTPASASAILKRLPHQG